VVDASVLGDRIGARSGEAVPSEGPLGGSQDGMVRRLARRAVGNGLCHTLINWIVKSPRPFRQGLFAATAGPPHLERCDY
jgi:hypothetical protein